MSLELVPYEVRLRVARVLLDRGTRSIEFTIGKYSVSGRDYETIAIHIHLGDIDVAYGTLTDMAETGGVAYYQGGSVEGRSDVLYLPRAYGGPDMTLDMRSVIVHEATHAIFDARQLAMRRLDAEMLAYFAQFWYSMANNLDLLVYKRELGTDSAVIGYGYDCVRQYRTTKGRIDRENIESFRKAILAMPLYGQAHEKWATSDGVSPTFRDRILNLQFRDAVLSDILSNRAGLSDPH